MSVSQVLRNNSKFFILGSLVLKPCAVHAPSGLVASKEHMKYKFQSCLKSLVLILLAFSTILYLDKLLNVNT